MANQNGPPPAAVAYKALLNAAKSQFLYAAQLEVDAGGLPTAGRLVAFLSAQQRTREPTDAYLRVLAATTYGTTEYAPC